MKKQSTYKICVISERLSRDRDEGIKNITLNFIRELSKEHTVLGLSARENINHLSVEKFNSNRFFLSTNLLKKVRNFNPDICFYIPWTSATVRSFFRGRLLKFYANNSKLVLIATQPQEHNFIFRIIIPCMRPDMIFAQSRKNMEILSRYGTTTEFMPSGVDLKKFKPVTNYEQKLLLREKMRLSSDKWIISHVGHINPDRIPIGLINSIVQHLENIQVIIIGSPDTHQDTHVIDNLRRMGVPVITDYLEKIEEIYHISDCYLFPVASERKSIGVPLSVMEAMACNLPIVSTLFQGLPSLFKERNGFYFAQGHSEFIDKISKIRELDPKDIKTREMVKAYSWENVVNLVWDKCTKYFRLD